MWKRVTYLRAGGRRPVSGHMYVQAEDVQAMPPRWWCLRCGGEVYGLDAVLCRRCIREKEDFDNGNEESDRH